MLEFFLKLKPLLSHVLVGTLHGRMGVWFPSVFFSPKGLYSSLLLPRLPLAALKVEIGDRKVPRCGYQHHLALVSAGLRRNLKLSFFFSWELVGDYPARQLRP